MHKEIRGKKIKGYTVRTPRYRYTEWGRGEFGTELYDYQADPEEFTNLAESKKHSQIVARLKNLLKESVQRAQP